MPYPSVGCQTCKLRRVKCDETKPICQRCTKAKRICIDSSIVKQASFAIHVENSFASGRAKRPRGPRSNIATLSPHFDLQARAVAYYLQYHSQALQDVPNLTRGLSECITIWKASGKLCPMVDLAIASLALVIFSRTQQHPPALTEASSNYYRLLGVAQHRIAQLSFPTLDEPNIESCLLAASLMSRYEGATLSPDKAHPTDIFTSDARWSHYDGVKAILKVWRDNFTQNAPNFIIKQTRRELLRTSLVRNLPLPDWMQDGSLFGEQDLEPEYDRIMVRVVNLHYAVMILQRQNSQLFSEAEHLDTEAQMLDKLLQAWSTNIPGACIYKQHVIPDLNPRPQRYFYSQTVYSFPKPGFASAWCQYFAVCLVINSVRCKIIELRRLDPAIGLCHKQLQDECTARLESMADNLACSIPFCLERIKVDNSSANQPSAILNLNEEVKPYLARLVSWPLLVASTVEGISTMQQRWFRQELSCLGRVTGDGLSECRNVMSNNAQAGAMSFQSAQTSSVRSDESCIGV